MGGFDVLFTLMVGASVAETNDVYLPSQVARCDPCARACGADYEALGGRETRSYWHRMTGARMPASGISPRHIRRPYRHRLAGIATRVTRGDRRRRLVRGGWCMCGRPLERKGFCVIWRAERVRSCVRPTTRPMTAGPDGSRRAGPQTRMRPRRALAPSGVSCSSVRPAAISCVCPFAPRR